MIMNLYTYLSIIGQHPETEAQGRSSFLLDMGHEVRIFSLFMPIKRTGSTNAIYTPFIGKDPESFKNARNKSAILKAEYEAS